MNLNSSRRGFLGTLGAVAAALAAPRKLFAAKPSAAQTAPAITGLGQSGNPYQELGVTRCVVGFNTDTEETVLPMLDRWAVLMRGLR